LDILFTENLTFLPSFSISESYSNFLLKSLRSLKVISRLCDIWGAHNQPPISE